MMKGKCYHSGGPHPAIPVWVCEHGESFAVPDILYNALDLLGFEDESWHNDVCPHFTYSFSESWKLDLWVQHPIKEQREWPAKERYHLYLTYTRAETGEDSLLIAHSDQAGDIMSMATTLIESSKADE